MGNCTGCRSKPGRSAGFTLLETLVALAIFAVCVAVLLAQSQRALHQQQQLEMRTVARWVAENKLAELQLQTPWPATGTSTDSVELGDRSWQVISTVADTARADFRRIEIAVYVEQGAVDAVDHLIGFVGLN